MSVRSIVFSFLFWSILAPSLSVAQSRFYYDRSFRSPAESATRYYRELTVTDTVTLVTEICQDSVMARGFIRGGDNPKVINEFAHYIKSFGNPYQKQDVFKTMYGEIDFYTKGLKQDKIVSRAGKVLYAQRWEEDGTPVLNAGSGSRSFENDEAVFHQTFADSVMTEMFAVRRIERDTIYYTFDQVAEPKNGYQEFTEDLVRILKYPGFARLMGKQGVVHVQFVIDKAGKLSEFKPLTNEGYNLEKRAVDRLAKMPAWKPAIFRGKAVKMKFIIPIRFRLT